MGEEGQPPQTEMLDLRSYFLDVAHSMIEWDDQGCYHRLGEGEGSSSAALDSENLRGHTSIS